MCIVVFPNATRIRKYIVCGLYHLQSEMIIL